MKRTKTSKEKRRKKQIKYTFFEGMQIILLIGRGTIAGHQLLHEERNNILGGLHATRKITPKGCYSIGRLIT
jgi:hypothetical protein